jgi:hypothetical protein
MDSPWLRITSEIIIVITFIVMYWGRWKEGVKARLWALPIVIWLLHSSIHYGVWLWFYYHGNPGGILAQEWILTWGAITRLHGFLTILILEVYRLLKGKFILNGH